MNGSLAFEKIEFEVRSSSRLIFPRRIIQRSPISFIALYSIHSPWTGFGRFSTIGIVDALLILTNNSQMQLRRVPCPCRKRPHKRALVSARLVVRSCAAYLTHDAKFLRYAYYLTDGNFEPTNGIVQRNDD